MEDKEVILKKFIDDFLLEIGESSLVVVECLLGEYLRYEGYFVTYRDVKISVGRKSGHLWYSYEVYLDDLYFNYKARELYGLLQRKYIEPLLSEEYRKQTVEIDKVIEKIMGKE